MCIYIYIYIHIYNIYIYIYIIYYQLLEVLEILLTTATEPPTSAARQDVAQRGQGSTTSTGIYINASTND